MDNIGHFPRKFHAFSPFEIQTIVLIYKNWFQLFGLSYLKVVNFRQIHAFLSSIIIFLPLWAILICSKPINYEGNGLMKGISEIWPYWYKDRIYKKVLEKRWMTESL